MKRSRKSIGIICVMVPTFIIAFKKPLFERLVTYEPVRVRASAPTKRVENPRSFDSAVRMSLESTAKKVRFTFEKTSSEPAEVKRTGVAHCVGYANLTAETFSTLNNEWKAETVVGHVKVLDVDVHQYIDHPFFKNHDFVVLTHRKTGERHAIDPSLYDYTGIFNVKLTTPKRTR